MTPRQQQEKVPCKACDGDGESRDSWFAGEPCEGCNGAGRVITFLHSLLSA